MKRKILFVDHESIPSGSTISLFYLIDAFLLQNYAVYVLSPKTGDQRDYLNTKKANVINIPSRFLKNITLDLHFTATQSAFSIKGLKLLFKNIAKAILGIYYSFEILKKISPDIVYLNEYVTIQVSIACYLLGIPCVSHIRSQFLKGTIGLRRWVLKKILIKFCDIIFAITDREKKQISESLQPEAAKIIVVPEFLDSVFFTTDYLLDNLKNKYSVRNDCDVVLFLGGVMRIKGTIDFIKAANIVSRINHNVLFLVAGINYATINDEEKKYFNKCRQIITHNKLEKKILFMGEVENVRELLFMCKILAVPTIESHFPRPVIEAWAMRKAVVAYKVEHIEDLIEDGVDGVLVTPKDYVKLSDGILNILGNPELQKKLGENGYKKAYSNFRAEINTSYIVQKCNELLKINDGI